MLLFERGVDSIAIVPDLQADLTSSDIAVGDVDILACNDSGKSSPHEVSGQESQVTPNGKFGNFDRLPSSLKMASPAICTSPYNFSNASEIDDKWLSSSSMSVSNFSTSKPILSSHATTSGSSQDQLDSVPAVPVFKPTTKGTSCAGKAKRQEDLLSKRNQSLLSTLTTQRPSLPKSSQNAILGTSAPTATGLVPFYETGGLLPANHRPARGRGRTHQLDKMTREQIEAEAEARLEKNRQSARECRLRRKQQVGILQMQVAELTKKDEESQQIIAKLQQRVRELEGVVASHS